MSATEPGLRERKKQRTRQLIVDAARELFSEHGFERVTVAQVARAAEVSEQTVYNYFPTKEDLLYSRLESFEAELLGAIREREPGESALAAFARFVRRPRGLMGDVEPEVREQLAGIARTIAESPALLAREQQIFASFTDSLARLLAEETGAEPDDVEPWVAANALMGVHRALVAYGRRLVVEGVPSPRLAREVRAQADRALARLEAGLGEYAERG